MKKSLLLLLSCFLLSSLFAQRIVSPEEGTWANRQMLVIEGNGECDFYYSVDGSDPHQFGFAYDGPVLLDLTGDVTLRVYQSNYDGTGINHEIHYTVNENYGDESSQAFLSTFMHTGLLNYVAGAEIAVPQTMEYAFGDRDIVYLKGRTISYSDECPVSRYLTVRLRQGESNWKFLMKTNPRSSGVFSRRDVPFVVDNWDSITFTDQNYIYKIDDGMWSLPKEPITLDRTVPHMIYWQSIAYEKGNPVDFFELPVRPEINVIHNDDGSLKLYFDDGATYAVCLADSQWQELFSTLTVDTFYGDEYRGVLPLKVFSDSVYQGDIQIPYDIDKRPPSVPVFTSSSSGFYSRQIVDVDISTEARAKLFVSVSEPFNIEERTRVYDPANPVFKEVVMGEFMERSGNLKIKLKPSDDNATYLKIQAYSSDGKNISEVSEYAVVIDRYNYYVNASSDPDLAAGTAEHPFVNLEQCFGAINKNRYARIFISGSVSLKKGNTELLSNCIIEGMEDATIIMPQGSYLSVNAASLSIKNVKFKCDNGPSQEKNMQNLFKLENAVLLMEDCDISANLGINGCVFDAGLSVLTFKNCVFSVTARSYASLLSANSSRLFVSDCMWNTTSGTSVGFSCREGEMDVKNSTFTVSGNMGRIAELFGVKGIFNQNTFRGDLSSSTATNSVYTDKNCSVDMDINLITGF